MRRFLYAFLVGMVCQLPTAHAELNPGTVVVYQNLVHLGKVLGQVVVTSDKYVPSGSGDFQPLEEYWYWDPAEGTPWPDAFHLEPVSSGYDYDDVTWETYDHDVFDLTTSVPMPAITLSGADQMYKVVEVDTTTTPPTTDIVAFFWLEGGSNGTPHWYGIDGVLSNEVIGVGVDVIRFSAIDPPAAGSSDVHEL